MKLIYSMFFFSSYNSLSFYIKSSNQIFSIFQQKKVKEELNEIIFKQCGKKFIKQNEKNTKEKQNQKKIV